MNKKFFKAATLTMVGTTALAIIVSYLYLLLGMKIANGDNMLAFLSTLETIFDYVQLSVGFATVVYAFAKFDFNDALKVLGVFATTVFAYAIIVMIPTGIYVNSLDYYGADFYYEFNAYINTVFFSFGNVLVCQVAPAAMMGAIMWKHTKERKPAPRKLISWKNPTQRGMIISCLSLALFNFVVRCLTEFSVLGELIKLKHVFGPVDETVKSVLLALLSVFLNCLIFNIIIMYLVCFFAYKIYDYISYENPNLKAKTTEADSDDEAEDKKAKKKATSKKK